MTFTVPGKPQGKQRARVTTVKGFARAYTPEQTVSYENYIKVCFLNSGGKLIPHGKAVRMLIAAVYQTPKSMSGKARNKALIGDIKPLVKPDIDNVIKVICDALNGVAYADDTQIVSITALKMYGEEPKITVTLEEI